VQVLQLVIAAATPKKDTYLSIHQLCYYVVLRQLDQQRSWFSHRDIRLIQALDRYTVSAATIPYCLSRPQSANGASTDFTLSKYFNADCCPLPYASFFYSSKAMLVRILRITRHKISDPANLILCVDHVSSVQWRKEAFGNVCSYSIILTQV
jgi:hypothetical protein